MFQSYEFLEYLGYDNNTNEYRWRYKIVDTEFEEVGVAFEVGVGGTAAAGLPAAVIDTYSNRGLPVVPNLVRAFQWYINKYGYSLEQLIAWNKQYNSKFAQYAQEVEKYLVLL
jgi:hypothetical protein